MLRSLARAHWGGLRPLQRRVLASRGAPQLNSQQQRQLRRSLGSYHPPEPANVIRVLHKAQNILGTRFNFSRIVMVGDQSSGKTSVLEGLIGEDISQKDNQMATRRPLLLSLIRTPPGSGMCAKFKDGERMYDFAEVKARILAENDVQDGDISPEPIQLTIYSEDVFDTILVDLPGFILSPQAHQDAELPHQIEKLNLPYLHDPQAILCVINSATVDPATSYSLREAFKADRAGDRSIGVVTKVDLVGENKDALSRMLRNEVYPIGLGRVGVRCRTHQEQLDGMSWPAAIKREAEWIETSGLKDKAGIRLGMPLLRQTLSELLIARVCKQLPLVIAQLDKRIKDAEHNQDFLKRLANEPNLRTVSKELESLVNQLHPASDSRSDFEKELREAMYAVTEEAFAAARAAHKFDFEHTTETRLLDKAKVPDYVSPAMTGTGYYDGYTPIAEYRSLLIANDQSHMDGVNNDTLRRLQKRGVQIGACAAYFDFVVPPNPRKARRQWFRDWNKALNRVLEAPSEDGDADAYADHTIEGDNLLAQRSYETFMDQLVQFAESAETDGNSRQSELARLYFRYILKKISNRIHEEGLHQEVRGMLARERRPMADFLEQTNELSKMLNVPNEYHWMWGDTTKKVEICLYNQEWTQAYFKLATKRVSDDLFRNYAVRILEPLVFEAIQFSLNMFRQGGAITREAEVAAKDAEELRECRDILAATWQHYQDSQNK